MNGHCVCCECTRAYRYGCVRGRVGVWACLFGVGAGTERVHAHGPKFPRVELMMCQVGCCNIDAVPISNSTQTPPRSQNKCGRQDFQFVGARLLASIPDNMFSSTAALSPFVVCFWCGLGLPSCRPICFACTLLLLLHLHLQTRSLTSAPFKRRAHILHRSDCASTGLRGSGSSSLIQ